MNPQPDIDITDVLMQTSDLAKLPNNIQAILAGAIANKIVGHVRDARVDTLFEQYKGNNFSQEDRNKIWELIKETVSSPPPDLIRFLTLLKQNPHEATERNVLNQVAIKRTGIRFASALDSTASEQKVEQQSDGNQNKKESRLRRWGCPENLPFSGHLYMNDEIEQLFKLLEPKEKAKKAFIPIVMINGPKGAGKTHLLKEYTVANKSNYDLIIWMKPVKKLNDRLEELKKCHKYDIDAEDDIKHVYKKLLSGKNGKNKKILIIGIGINDAADYKQLPPPEEYRKNIHVIVTSINQSLFDNQPSLGKNRLDLYILSDNSIATYIELLLKDYCQNQKEASVFLKRLGAFPRMIAYIASHLRETNNDIGDLRAKYKCDGDIEKHLLVAYLPNGKTKTIYNLWGDYFRKVKEKDEQEKKKEKEKEQKKEQETNDSLSWNLLAQCSFLSTKIPRKIFSQDTNDTAIVGVLRKYSLITLERDFIKMNLLIQQAIRFELEKIQQIIDQENQAFENEKNEYNKKYLNSRFSTLIWSPPKPPEPPPPRLGIKHYSNAVLDLIIKTIKTENGIFCSIPSKSLIKNLIENGLFSINYTVVHKAENEKKISDTLNLLMTYQEFAEAFDEIKIYIDTKTEKMIEKALDDKKEKESRIKVS